MQVGKHYVEVDILSEIEPYLDQFSSYRIREDKLQSCSPFRQDSHPSFAVNLDNGSWIDSGAVGDYHKGHFIELLAFLREETVEDTVEYLLDSYQIERQDVSELQLDMSFLQEKEQLPFISTDILKQFAFRHPYLADRGISEKVQKLFRVGYDKESKAIAMPHTDKAGNITNIKFRSIQSKKFWYYGGQQVKNNLYGLYQCIQTEAEEIWVVESETDCLRLWTYDFDAVALGTAHISSRQIKLLLSTKCKTLNIATDNDAAGKECSKQLSEIFGGKMKIMLLQFPPDKKDICDLTVTEMDKIKENLHEKKVKAVS